LLEKIFKNYNSGGKFKVLDIGCGDGSRIASMIWRKLTLNREIFFGLEISQDKIFFIKKYIKIKLIRADALELPIRKDSFDIIILSQVIEHIKEEKKLISNINRILKKNSVFYLSTIFKRRYAKYFYNQGLDPTHVREYNSPGEIKKMIKNSNFKIKEIRINKLSYPIIDFVLRFLVKFRLKKKIIFIGPTKTLSFLRKFRIPIVGYYFIEIEGIKK